ncbi:protein translocase subunit SecF [Guyparkeria hydrothermalis]|uniref:protein translocase subunit SecF n=1 Tax=Guyparkeria TaxID=2035712 RepID=UPI0010AC9797|nr:MULTISPECIES: protein translocase subunit SecF [Guyparkeria]MCL7751003.1 protein translocase subunit SecF [Guyparkeria hydrothermalis]TKA88913.1 protein translocase subunit SecF [Guyparkeria sp. SB14A]
MNLFPSDARFDFFGKRYFAYALSAILLLVAAGSLATKGLNLGLDFTGGVVIELGYPGGADIDAVRETLDAKGFENAVAQLFGSSESVMIRLPPTDDSHSRLADELLIAMQSETADVEMRRVEYVGPAVGKELFNAGGLALLVVLAGILVYVGFRFQVRLAGGAILALAHDLVVVLGIVSLLGLRFDLTVLAAFLALAGYSINDTIVVFDRIRENFQKMRKGTEKEVMNASVNQTMSRTVITSGTTFLTALALFVFGGEALSGFSLTLLLGIAIGTFSSIYVASAVSLDMGLKRQDLLKIDDKERLKQAEDSNTP